VSVTFLGRWTAFHPPPLGRHPVSQRPKVAASRAGRGPGARERYLVGRWLPVVNARQRQEYSKNRTLRWRYTCRVATCSWCGSAFAPSGRRAYCSNACRQASYRARHQPEAPHLVAPAKPGAVVYECPGCAERYLSPVRRCPDCNLFCRRVGPGGTCPACGTPVAYEELGS